MYDRPQPDGSRPGRPLMCDSPLTAWTTGP